jgi:peptidoglycan hydrolase-like protein with peptidoglycan-binding domain
LEAVDVRKFITALAAVACVALVGGAVVAEAKTPKATVVAVQQKLGVAADGVMGPQTKRALKRFQRRNGLTVDGVIGPQTLGAMGLSAHQAKKKRGRTATLEEIAECESGGDPTAISRDGRYRGKYQFSRATWRALGGAGDPAKAPEAEQDSLARILMQRQGPSAWPTCSKV